MEEDHCTNLTAKPFCSYKGCSVEIDVPSGGTYCRRHRQQVYKKNYLKRSKKFRTKYQESKACFSGSPNSFDGQDIDDMLHQVLVKKRVDLMCNPEIVDFLKTHQEHVRTKASEDIEKPVMREEDTSSKTNESPCSTFVQNYDINANFKTFDMSSISVKHEPVSPWRDVKIDPARFDRGLTPLSPADSKIGILSTGNLQLFQRQFSSKALTVVKPEFHLNLVSGTIGQHASYRAKDILSVNSTREQTSLPSETQNLTSTNRRSAFQATGAGDAKSLLAIRAVQFKEDQR